MCIVWDASLAPAATSTYSSESTVDRLPTGADTSVSPSTLRYMFTPSLRQTMMCVAVSNETVEANTAPVHTAQNFVAWLALLMPARSTPLVPMPIIDRAVAPGTVGVFQRPTMYHGDVLVFATFLAVCPENRLVAAKAWLPASAPSPAVIECHEPSSAGVAFPSA
jgi:hypothetical protein